MDHAGETREQRAARRWRIGVRLVLYPLALGLIAVAWNHEHGVSTGDAAPDTVQWTGVTSQGQPIRGTTSGVLLTYLHVTVPQPCSDGGHFDFTWLPGEGRFVQYGDAAHAEHSYRGYWNGRNYLTTMRVDARVGAHPTGTLRGTTVTGGYRPVSCESGPVTFTLHR